MLKPRNSFKVITALLLAGCLAGCSLIAPHVGPELAKGINRYCEQPFAERQLVRDSINAQIAPHSVRVTCATDPPDPPPTTATGETMDKATQGKRDRLERVAARLLAPSSTVREAVDRAIELCAEVDQRCTAATNGEPAPEDPPPG